MCYRYQKKAKNTVHITGFVMLGHLSYGRITHY